MIHHTHGSKNEKAPLSLTFTAVVLEQTPSLDSLVLDQRLELVEVGQMTWITKAK